MGYIIDQAQRYGRVKISHTTHVLLPARMPLARDKVGSDFDFSWVCVNNNVRTGVQIWYVEMFGGCIAILPSSWAGGKVCVAVANQCGTHRADEHPPLPSHSSFNSQLSLSPLFSLSLSGPPFLPHPRCSFCREKGSSHPTGSPRKTGRIVRCPVCRWRRSIARGALMVFTDLCRQTCVRASDRCYRYFPCLADPGTSLTPSWEISCSEDELLSWFLFPFYICLVHHRSVLLLEIDLGWNENFQLGGRHYAWDWCWWFCIWYTLGSSSCLIQIW